MSKLFVLLCSFLLFSAFFGCTQKNDDSSINANLLVFSKLDDSLVTNSGMQDLSNANNTFALDFYKEIDSAENSFFSPFSIFSAMGMVYEGAKDNTAKEFESVLYYPTDSQERHAAFAKTFNDLIIQEDYNLIITNMLWPAVDFKLNTEFENNIKNYFYGGVKTLDYSNIELASKEINDFVELNTNGLIKDLLTPDDVIDARLILTNTIYFFSNWENKFEKENTTKNDFFIDERKVTADLMNQTQYFNYFENQNFQVLNLPYINNKLSMIVFLPKETTASEFDFVTNKDFVDIKNSMRRKKVNVTLPKFKVEAEYSLVENFKNLGLTTAFTGAANFSGISDERLLISDIIHKTFIEVNEESTEAAAATAIIMKVTSMPPMEEEIIEFNANHPFVYLIVDNKTNNILFMGKLVNPTN